MKGSKREGAGRKKKSQGKSLSKSTKKKSSLKKVVELEGEIRPNKHRSYLKIVKDEETGARTVVRGGRGAHLLRGRGGSNLWSSRFL
jgi:hypothetical protein